MAAVGPFSLRAFDASNSAVTVHEAHLALQPGVVQ
jgi:hypothetical protein